jgi:hypothetical protein
MIFTVNAHVHSQDSQIRIVIDNVGFLLVGPPLFSPASHHPMSVSRPICHSFQCHPLESYDQR